MSLRHASAPILGASERQAAGIDGRTRLVGVLADPVAHLKSPEVFNALFAASRLDMVMVPMHLDGAGLRAAWAGLRAMRNLAGLTVAVPHKAAIVPLCDSLGAAARRAGTANVVRREADGRMVGDSCDGAGFLAGLREGGHDPRGRRALIVGTGGAGAAVAFALAEAAVAALVLANRTRARAEALADRLRAAFPSLPVAVGDADLRGCSLVVNATSLGMRPDDPPPIPADRLEAGSIVADLVMDPQETSLVASARAKGCTVHPARMMLEGQARLIAAFITASRVA